MSDERSVPRRKRPDSGRTRRALFVPVVAMALAGLLVAGAVFPGHGVPAVARLAPGTLVPEIDLTSPASVWNCPGPLPVGGTSASSIAIANPGARPARLSVLVAETAVTADEPKEYPDGEPLRNQVLELRLSPRSERDLPIVAEAVPPLPATPVTPATTGTTAVRGAGKKKGAKQPRSPSTTVDASVSVTVSGSGVAVSEIVHLAAQTLARPCAVGSATDGYTASGVTAGSSDAHVAVFDPSAAPAVVNVAVGTAAGFVEPQAYQGVTVAPMSLVVLDLAQYVPQRARVAVSVHADVGHVVIGSFASISAGFHTKVLGRAHSYEESGQELVVGIGRPLARWVMPLGPVGANYSEEVRIFDPGSRGAVVMIRTSTADAKPASLTVSVAPGQTVTVAAPLVSLGAKPASPVTHSTSSTEPPPASGGVVTLTSTNGVGIVVEHETYETSPTAQVVLVSSAPSVADPTRWIVPGMVQSASLAGSVSITDAGAKAVSVSVEEIHQELSGGAAPASSQVTVELRPGGTVTVPLRSLVALESSVPFGLEVTGTGPVLVTGELQPAKKGAQPAVESGVPAT